MLSILLVRAVTLQGAMDGIKYYIIPDWPKLLSLQVWAEAAMQIFFSMGAAWGGMITLASYNKFNQNCYMNACIIPLLSGATSILVGFVTFAVIGFMAHSTGRDVSEVVTQGPGLVFVVYPSAISNMAMAPLWSILYFLVLFMIGLDSQFCTLEIVISAIIDEYPKIFNTPGRKRVLRAVICFAEYLFGIPCVMQGGMYVLQIMDWYSSVFTLMIISFCECLVIGWIYGASRFYIDISLMRGSEPCIYWKILWCFITPSLVMFIFGFTVLKLQPVTYGDYSYPSWALGLGWTLALCSLIPIPVTAIIKVSQAKGSFLQKIRQPLKPSSEYAPSKPSDRQKYMNSITDHRPNIGLGYDPSIIWETEAGSLVVFKP